MQKNQLLSVILGVVVVGLIIFSVASQKSETPSPASPSISENATTTETTSSSSSQEQTSSSSGAYTLTEVAQHKDETSCWSAIDGGVYDLTSWISQHPGGSREILRICGKDGSIAFNRQHGGAEEQAAILRTFKIGTLAQ